MQPAPNSPAPAPQVTTRVWDDQAGVLFDPDTGQQRTVNETGLQIWSGLLANEPPASIAATLVQQYDGLDAIGADAAVAQFVDELLAEGFVLPEAGQGDAAAAVAHDAAPQELDLSLTGRCNLRCEHCFYADDMVARDDLPGDQWLQFLDELGRLAVKRVCLTGGEVTTRRDLWTLIDGIVRNRMRFTMLTNGTLINEGMVGRLARRRARLENIQVSLDGATAEVHDRFRGPGSFVAAVHAVRLLREAGMPVSARVTVNRYNVFQLDEIIRFLLEDLGLPYVSTNSVLPVGAAHKNNRRVTLNPAERQQAMTDLVRLAGEYEGRVMANDGPLAQARQFAAMEQAEAGEAEIEPWMGRLTACGCVFGKLAVHHDGTLVPCALLSEATLGRINLDPLTDIWRSHPTLQAMRCRRSTTMRELPQCAGCRWVEVCNGGCPAHPFAHHGDLGRPSDFHCYSKYLQEVSHVDSAE